MSNQTLVMQYRGYPTDFLVPIFPSLIIGPPSSGKTKILHTWGEYMHGYGCIVVMCSPKSITLNALSTCLADISMRNQASVCVLLDEVDHITGQQAGLIKKVFQFNRDPWLVVATQISFSTADLINLPWKTIIRLGDKNGSG